MKDNYGTTLKEEHTLEAQMMTWITYDYMIIYFAFDSLGNLFAHKEDKKIRFILWLLANETLITDV